VYRETWRVAHVCYLPSAIADLLQVTSSAAAIR
jgi:hypothetical protein